MMSQLFVLLGMGVLIWLGYRVIKHGKGLFTWDNFHRTAFVLGILALILIVVIFIAVKFLKGVH